METFVKIGIQGFNFFPAWTCTCCQNLCKTFIFINIYFNRIYWNQKIPVEVERTVGYCWPHLWQKAYFLDYVARTFPHFNACVTLKEGFVWVWGLGRRSNQRRKVLFLF